MAKFRVRRTHPNEYAQNQATTLKECKVVLGQQLDKWKDILNDKYTRAFGHTYRSERTPKKLTIYKDILDIDNDYEVVETVVADQYVIEEA